MLIATDLPDPVVPAMRRVRYLGKVRDDRIRRDILAERQRKPVVAVAVIPLPKGSRQHDLLAHLFGSSIAEDGARGGWRHAPNAPHRTRISSESPITRGRLEAGGGVELGTSWTTGPGRTETISALHSRSRRERPSSIRAFSSSATSER